MTMKRVSSVIVVAFLLVGGSTASAGYIITPESDGADAIVRAPGDTFELDLLLEFVPGGGGGPHHDFSFFSVYFDKPGLNLQDYNWPWNAGFKDVLPAAGPISGQVNFQGMDFTGVNAYEAMGDTYLTLIVEVPLGFLPGDVIITVDDPGAQDDLDFQMAQGAIATVAGGEFTLTVTPEPATLSLLALGGLALIRRKRRG